MNQREIKRDLEDAMFDGVEGSGGELTLKLRAWRTTKAGTRERYELRIKMGRWNVGRLLGQLKEMHVRDRDRIAHEQLRIQKEIDALKVAP